MRPYGDSKALERRRRAAIPLFKRGMGVREVARRLKVEASSVCKWRQAYLKEGENGLIAKPVPGRPRKLADGILQRLLTILLEGALAYGYPNDLWTLKRIGRVIQQEFGVHYHHCHVWKLLRQKKWSCQVPERRAWQRDDKAIAHWKRYKWPAIKKSPKTWCPPCFPRRERLSAHSNALENLGS